MTEPSGRVVKRSVVVGVDAATAFDVFTNGLDRWWLRGYHIGSADMVEAVLEPWHGGRWFERDADGNECDWGYVLAYEPPHRLVLAWQIDAHWRHDPSLITEVEVHFVPRDANTTAVEVEHRNLDRFGPDAHQMQIIFESPNGWVGLLQAFSQAVA